jgi:hypothetical protein
MAKRLPREQESESSGAGIVRRYREFRAALGDARGTALLSEITEECASFLLAESRRVELRSLVEGKRYFAFKATDTRSRLSRPVNDDLYISNREQLADGLKKLTANPGMDWVSVEECNRLLYTIARSFCAFNDLTSDQNKKTPGEYFEMLVGHLLALTFGVMPRNRVQVLTIEDERTTLPTDYIFDLGPRQPKFHVPVKISTRERVVQVWAHQRMLNGVYGEGRFRGVLVALAETKLDLRKLEVVEICLPGQWAVYQRFVARMDRVYYLDVPLKYAALASAFPYIPVKSFGVFFKEKEALIKPPGA